MTVWNLAAIAALIALSLVFFLNSWVSEDAFINFRVVEQFYDGNGLVWNPGERVQVFTSPLWLLTISIGRAFSADLFVLSLVISFLFFMASCLVLWRLVREPLAWLFCCSLFLVSSTYFDYTTSGLEYPLIYFLLSVFWYVYLIDFNISKRGQSLKLLVTVFSLLLLTRHDLLLLCFPAFAHHLWRALKTMKVTSVLLSCLLYSAPFWLWTLFSLLYYGFPFPNTAYAKLGTGIDTPLLIAEGLRYTRDMAAGDTISLIVLIAAALFSVARKDVRFGCIAAGIVLSALYVILVRGDYMTGRFFSPAVFSSIVTIGLIIKPVIHRRMVLAVWISAWVFYVALYYHTPVRSNFNHETFTPQGWAEMRIESNTTIVDAREMHSSISTLRGYLERTPDQLFPGGPYTQDALEANMRGDSVVVYGAIGMFGYLISPGTTVVDELAISDPLLARLPTSRSWRVSHYPRTIPEGYLESLRANENLITDESLAEFYDHLRLITRGEALFAPERLEKIFLMNTGKYDFLLQRYINANPQIYDRDADWVED